MSTEQRAALATAQHALVAALVTGAAPPEGFDAARIRVQAHALANKRRRAAAAHHPRLAEALATNYPALFATYALARPLPGASAHADAAGFVEYLHGLRLPPDVTADTWKDLVRLLAKDQRSHAGHRLWRAWSLRGGLTGLLTRRQCC